MVAGTACGSSGNPNGSPDASATSDSSSLAVDAATTVVDSADHIDAAPSSPDAAPISPDATPPDAAPLQPVTVTVFDPNSQLPATGLPVAFLNGDSSVVLETTTDSNGSASATMAAGGSVTVGAAQVGVDINGNSGNVYTWLGVKPGDDLVANQPLIPTSAATITINVTTDTDTNANDYQINGFCPDGETFSSNPSDGGPTAIVVPSTCTPAAIYVFAEDANGVELSTVYQSNIALSDGAAITIGAFTPVATDSVTFTDIPSAQISGNTSFRSTLYLDDGINLLRRLGAKVSSSTGTATKSFVVGAMSNVNLLNWFQVSTNLTTNDNVMFAVSSGPSITTGVSADLAPLLAVATVTSEPAYDVPSATFSWMEAGSVPADLVSIIENVHSIDGTTRVFSWNIVAADTNASLVLPTLPASLADFTILSTDLIGYGDAFTISVTGGYDVVRNTAIGTKHPQSSLPGLQDISVLSSGSQYVLQSFQD